jgi:hypothetical protein
VRSDAETDPSEVVGFDRGDRPPEWQVVGVTVDGERHPASGGGSIETVTNVDYTDRFEFIRSEWYRCDCGVKLHGEQMARHLGQYHGIEEGAAARSSVKIAPE